MGAATPAALPALLPAVTHFVDMAKELIAEVFESPIIRAKAIELVDSLVPSAIARYNEFEVKARAAIIARLAAEEPRVEELAGPTLRALAAKALHALFGTSLDPAMLSANPEDAGRQLAHAVMQSIVGESQAGGGAGGGGISPEAGPANAERFVATVLSLVLEGWFETSVEFGWISKEIPQFAELKESIARHLGFGRLAPRALRPLFDVFMADPLRAHLNATFLPATYSEAEATRAVNRGTIGEDEYFQVMARHGWARGPAALHRVINTTQLSRSDLQQLYDQRRLSLDDVRTHLRAQGYNEGFSDAIAHLIQDDRVSSMRNALATVARDMYRSREIDDAEAQQLLASIDYSDDEIAAFLALGRVERARPKTLALSVAERAYNLDLVDEAGLRVRYELEGYAAPDVEILLSLAVLDKRTFTDKAEAKKLGRPAKLTDSDYVEFYRRGIIDSTALRADLVALRLPPDQVELVAQRAQQLRAAFLVAQRRGQEAAAGVKVTRATVEEAYIRSLLDDAQLQSAYTQAGFATAEIALLMILRRQERDEFQKKQAAAAAAAGSSGTKLKA